MPVLAHIPFDLCVPSLILWCLPEHKKEVKLVEFRSAPSYYTSLSQLYSALMLSEC